MIELVYSLVQAGHNLGAVAVAASPLAALLVGDGALPAGVALLPRRHASEVVRRRLSWLLLAGWGVQAASGAGFALTSYGFKGQLPEVAGVALAALVVKLACTAGGLALALLQVRRGGRWRARTQAVAWSACLALAVTALSAAAVLRWFL